MALLGRAFVDANGCENERLPAVPSGGRRGGRRRDGARLHRRHADPRLRPGDVVLHASWYHEKLPEGTRIASGRCSLSTRSGGSSSRNSTARRGGRRCERVAVSPTISAPPQPEAHVRHPPLVDVCWRCPAVRAAARESTASPRRQAVLSALAARLPAVHFLDLHDRCVRARRAAVRPWRRRRRRLGRPNHCRLRGSGRCGGALRVLRGAGARGF